MKRSEFFFNLISIAVDFVMIMLAGVGAFYFRLRLTEFRPIIYSLSLSGYLEILFLISPIVVLLLALAGLYNLKGTRRFVSEFSRVFLAVSSGLLGVVILFFFNQTVFPSRLIILMTWGLAIVLVSLGRIILRRTQIAMLKQGIGLHRLAVVNDESGNGLVNEIEKRPELGYKIVALLKLTDLNKLLEELEQIRKNSGIDEIMVANPKYPSEVNERLLAFCRDYGILFNFVPNVFETSRVNIQMETISGTPVIILKGTPLEGWGKFMKRVLDVLISSLALIMLSPFFFLIAVALKLTSRGPVFFHQPRAAGLASFECYKFRTMYYEMSEGTAQGDKLREELEKQNARPGPFVKIKNDPRVMPLGRFLRRTKLDEMPQLWHILRGQMSLVGPRVHMVKEVVKFQDMHKKIFTIKPGATGLTQITQVQKPELSFEDEIRLDTFYLENWSLWLDLYIIFKTLLILLGKKPKVDY
ncbi:MAG: hypothetical protein A3E98_02265 [Candidatus Doudnabacteria bacterium RIFCSPHIGHO2_12_FULL_48_11]|uniref:Bacterial sugar transferase domain-containing protein n=1 Tax=Candidatus Doudnabacteria bacterium RIFCSPHIGHO2_01_FULL_46_24 TaxID=1817825 RepID=A0A1F5NU59_9BACT|nr:MAG: hypothetical protein A2720_01395 [Candidatus Doudnabacteria bacterium RIFCSPHIGHO2_01_FULL_46_24]OGE96051.1 MAG: hypothetical protein A3E98_02265 [Candidatus Doudnabacteria bacterium RIFCSPHIGHO2_12_FULL_48_11]